MAGDRTPNAMETANAVLRAVHAAPELENVQVFTGREYNALLGQARQLATWVASRADDQR